MASQDEIHNLHTKLSGEIRDLDNRVLNRRKEEKEKERQEMERTSKLIKDVQLAIQSKASQSDLDKIRNKTQPAGDAHKINTPSSANDTNSTDKQDEESVLSPRPTNKGYNDRERNNSRKKVINAHVVLLMDSNRRYIETENFGEVTWKIRTAMAQDLESVIDRFDFNKVKHVIIATGTNDTDTRQVDDIFADLVRGAETLNEAAIQWC